MKVADLEVDGKKIGISVSERGEFTAVLDGEPYKADTMEKLKEKLVRSRRRASVRITIPATLALASRRFNSDGETLKDIEVTGIHRRNRNILFKYADSGKAGDTSYNDTILKRLDEASTAKYLQLQKAMQDSKAAFEAYKTARTITTESIKRQVEAAEKAAGIEPSGRDDD
jgi:hypothetical protein